MISGDSSSKHDYCYIRDRLLQNKLLAADDSFEQAWLGVAPPCANLQQRPVSLPENKICEVAGWCPNGRLVLRRPENDLLSKPKTASKDPSHDRGWRDPRLRRETPENNFVFHHYPDIRRYIEQYRNEHTCCATATPGAAKTDCLEHQRVSLSSARNFCIASSYADATHSKKEQAQVPTPQPPEPTSRTQKFKLTPSSSSDDHQTTRWSADHAVIPPVPFSQSQCSVSQPTSRMSASKFSSKIFQPATLTTVPKTLKLSERSSSSRGTRASWDGGSAWKTLDTLAVMANTGSKQIWFDSSGRAYVSLAMRYEPIKK